MAEYGESAGMAAELALEDISEDVPSWYRGVAFTILILSVVTALSALLAGMTAHETLLDRTEEIIDVSIAETDQLTVEVLRSKHDIQTALGQPVNAEELEEIERMEADAERYETEAEEAEASALDAASDHLLLAIAATIAAIAIAVTGLAPIVFQRWLWIVGILIGSLATVLLVIGVTRIVA
jgi:hypothetical protein